MKTNTIKLAATSLFFSFTLLLSAESFAVLGDPRTKHIDEDFILPSSYGLTEPSVAAPIIEKYIRTVNPSREKKEPDQLSTRVLAQRIAGAAYCFGVDPFVFAALINQESSYDQDNVSDGYAQGYTQFTSIAVTEVNEQLGVGNKAGQKPKALPSTVEYLNNIITGNCLQSQGGFTDMGSEYDPLWTVGKAKAIKDGTKTESLSIMYTFPVKPEYAIVYGAIYLKVSLSKVLQGFKTACYAKTHPGKVESIDEQFHVAIMSYNGDTCYQQENYVKKILGYYKSILASAN